MTDEEIILMKVKPHWSMFVVPGILALLIIVLSLAVRLPVAMILSVVVLLPKIIQYISVELIVSSKRIHGKNGLFSSAELDTPINRVNDVSVSVPFLGKIFHYGDIMIQAGMSTYKFPCIGNPVIVRETVMQAAEDFENAKFERQTRQLVTATARQSQIQTQMAVQQTQMQAQMLGQMAAASQSTPQQMIEKKQTPKMQQTEEANDRVIRKVIPHALWYRECPVLVSQCFIADKNANGDIDLNLELMNISDKNVEAIYVDVQGFNVLKEEKCFLKDIPVLDLHIKPAECLMMPKPIDLPDNSIRQIKLYIRHVVFEDENIWNYDGEEEFYGVEVKQEEIPSHYAKDLDGLCGRVTAHKYSGKRYPFYPVFENDFWLCACGQFNTGFKCVACDEDKELIKLNFRPDLLEAEYQKRMEAERETERLRQEELRLQKEREEAERLAKEEERRQKIEKLQNTAKGFINAAGKKSREAGEKLSQTVGQAKEQAENAMNEMTAQREARREEKRSQELQEGNERYCTECGARLDADARFCAECGAKIEPEQTEDSLQK